MHLLLCWPQRDEIDPKIDNLILSTCSQIKNR